jgi:hypothetical protein
MFLFLIISIFPVYFNRAKPIIGNPFYLRRVLTNSPKGEMDKSTLALLNDSKKDEILNNYIFNDSNYTLKKDLTKSIFSPVTFEIKNIHALIVIIDDVEWNFENFVSTKCGINFSDENI